MTPMFPKNAATLFWQDLVVRVCFILGNLTAKNDSSRKLLFDQPDALDTLLMVLKSYFEMDLKVGLINDL